MYRGTTPSFTLNVNTNLDLKEAEQIWVTFKSLISEVTVDKNGLVINEENKIEVTLSQEQTLLFNNGTLDVQIRILLNNIAYASNIQKIDVNRILKDGVINNE